MVLSLKINTIHDSPNWPSLQAHRLDKFLRFAYLNSAYYRKTLTPHFTSSSSDYHNIPFLNKEALIKSVDEITTFSSSQGRYISYTGVPLVQ